MTFVTVGLAVAGLLAMTIPILIHLLWRQRRTPVLWGAMRFLIEAYRKQRRRLQLEQIILLAVRCLILLLLGAALARPLLEGADFIETGGNRTLYLVLDNGLAATAHVDGDETAFARQVQRAIELVEGLDSGDRVGVITAAHPVEDRLQPASTDHAGVIALLRDIGPAASPTDLPAALDAVATAVDDAEDDATQVLVYLLSEFRAGSARLDDALPERLAALGDHVVLRAGPPGATELPNVQVTDLQPARRLVLPGAIDGSRQIRVQIARTGGELDADFTRVRLEGDGVTRVEPKVVEWAPGQSEATVDFLLDFASQREHEIGLTVSIDDDRLDGDNRRHTVLALRKEIRVVLIDRRSFGFEPMLDRLTAGQWLRRALEPAEASPVEVIEVEPAALDRADLRSTDVAILPRPDLLSESAWPLLAEFVDRGGLLLVTPPAEKRVHEWTTRMTDALQLPWRLERETVDDEAGLALADAQPSAPLLQMISSDLEALALPVRAFRRLPLDMAQSQAEVVLRFADGSPFVVAGSPAPEDADTDAARTQGMVVYIASAPQLSWTNLPSKPLMVPLVHETVRQGVSIIRSRRPVRVAEQPVLAVGPAASRLATPDGSVVPLDERRRPDRRLDDPGLYQVLDAAQQPIGVLAVNVEPVAARTDAQPRAAVRSWLQKAGAWEFFDTDDLTAALRRAEERSPLAGLLLLAVLLLLIVETVLARWFSHAWRRGARFATPGLAPTISGSPSALAGGGS
jgi:hypothetical protein